MITSRLFANTTMITITCFQSRLSLPRRFSPPLKADARFDPQCSICGRLRPLLAFHLWHHEYFTMATRNYLSKTSRFWACSEMACHTPCNMLGTLQYILCQYPECISVIKLCWSCHVVEDEQYILPTTQDLYSLIYHMLMMSIIHAF